MHISAKKCMTYAYILHEVKTLNLASYYQHYRLLKIAVIATNDICAKSKTANQPLQFTAYLISKKK